jgi:hypothetical protein
MTSMTALPDRIAGMRPDPAGNEAHTQWVRGYYAALRPHSDPGSYVNFASVGTAGHPY